MSNKALSYVAIAIAVLALIVGGYALVEAGNDVTSMGLHPGSTSNVSGNIAVSGTGDFTGNLQAGADDNYMFGYASAGYEIVCGTTGIFTDTTDVTVTALTAVSWAVATQITVPNATASMAHVAGISTNVVTIDTLEADYTAGTTGANVYYCAVGTE